MANPTYPSPKITFQVNLQTRHRQGHAVPNRTVLAGNETVSEADQMKNTRSTWVPGLFQCENVVRKDGDRFVAYGSKATYLKRTYATGQPDSVLTVVSVE
jgi:hypothetical protein